MLLRSRITSFIASLRKEYVTYNNVYISAPRILHNFDTYKKTTSQQIIPVLKSNAYGHGLTQITNILKKRHMPYIAVDGYFEALSIHTISKQPVLIMGAILPINFKNIQPSNDAFVVHQLETTKAMANTGKHFKVHIEIETGMGRQGLRLDELPNFLEQIKRYKNLEVEGIMTHLADADNPKSTKHSSLQTKRFDTAVEILLQAGFKPTYIHIGQSAGSLKVTSKYANTIRLGIGLYGISPLTELDPFAHTLTALKPVLTLTSSIAKILTVDTRESISYGCTFTAKRTSKIGILPLGYYEGLPRALSNTGVVKIGDQYAPIVGRVCMNHTMIDLTDIGAELEDEVIIISSEPTDKNSVQNICKQHQLFNYSFLVGINQTIRRTIQE